ncbi:hypothetical protein BaRGS_00029071 [Batillaria attramentaria]|uniref:Uncharacterized protein n=1 Tax=Batillaria attramentaria TaxID=370345 RepID=A0ABD0JYM4_9CAEN
MSPKSRYPTFNLLHNALTVTAGTGPLIAQTQRATANPSDTEQWSGIAGGMRFSFNEIFFGANRENLIIVVQCGIAWRLWCTFRNYTLRGG